ncbi:MAG: serine/threonine protein phosphatase PrpC [Gammaproteobacteria bacterium]|jgi:serine/threonine protein phosphatase PrpC
MEMSHDPIATYGQESQLEQRIETLNGGSIAMFSARAPNKTTVNEDAYAVIPVDEQTLILAVADGAGGLPHGNLAARFAIESLIEAVTDGRGEAPRVSIVNGFEQGQKKICEQIPGAATTLIVVEITNRTARTYHAGDSGACIIGGRSKMKGYTVFHSPTGYAVEAGLLSEDEAMYHEARHIVSNVLGDPNMSVEIGTTVDLAPNDTIVIASDGLYDNLFREEVGALACRGSLEFACRTLIEVTTTRMLNPYSDGPSKPDDLTVLMYRQNRS